ncbi:primase-helicase family protein [Ruegeria arenilitoris]|uniref:primase-helicase family protein n=1 Tax=Ruegeria arenilitoris TaxID=1173585 RepID=UPI00147F9C62|nr:primase-helicase family protein [Ruegeria arenilitoris]
MPTFTQALALADQGKETTIRCIGPGHTDHNPSLLVRPGDQPGTYHLCCLARRCSKSDLETAANELVENVAWADKPSQRDKPKRIPEVPVSFGLPKQANKADKIHEIRNGENALLAVVLRWGSGQDKVVKPYYFGKDENGQRWVPGWPSGEQRPLYGLDRIEKRTPDIPVALHEGEDAADAGNIATQDETHPWHKQLRRMAHASVMAGAGPQQTDLRPLRGRTVYIFRDKDKPGLEKAVRLADALEGIAAAVYISDPSYFDQLRNPKKHDGSGWDLADGTFGARGVDFMSKFRLRTFPYDRIVTTGPQGGERVSYFFRPHYAELFVHFKNRKTVCELRKLDPDEEVTSGTFTSYYHHPFAPSKNAYEQVVASPHTEIVYDYGTDPSLPFGALFYDGGRRYANLFRGPDFDPVEGDIAPFLAFAEHLFPDPRERNIALAWFAVVAGNRTRDRGFLWAICAISHETGTGKTTFGELLSELVGRDNADEITPQLFSSDRFNEWYRGKRIIVVEEARESGKSPWGFTEALKPYITNEFVSIAERYRGKATTRNIGYWYLSSNHDSAINIDDTDRRYFVPRVTETKMSADQISGLRSWFYKKGGKQAVLHWALAEAPRIMSLIGTPEGIEKGYTVEAPITDRKLDLQEDNLSEAAQYVQEHLGTFAKTLVLSSQDVREFIKTAVKDRQIDKPKGRPDLVAKHVLTALGFRKVWDRRRSLFQGSGVQTKLGFYSQHDFGKEPNSELVRKNFLPLSAHWSSLLGIAPFDPRGSTMGIAADNAGRIYRVVSDLQDDEPVDRKHLRVVQKPTGQ